MEFALIVWAINSVEGFKSLALVRQVLRGT